MFGYDNISLNLSYNPFYFFLAVLIIIAYTVYVYRFTLPKINTLKKILLVALRAAALLIIALTFFEPVLSLSEKVVITPVNLIFIDNSRSIKIDDGTSRIETVKNIASTLRDEGANPKFYLFGNTPRPVSEDSLRIINFDDGITNISKIFSSIRNREEETASITIITDGVYTDGSNPLYSAAKSVIPVYTIGIGDTAKRKDISIKKLLYNNLLYAGAQTHISVTVQNTDFGGEGVLVSLFENEKLVDQKNILLSKTGSQKIDLLYKPATSGEKKLTVTISRLEDEFTGANNKNIFYVNVLSNKINVLLLSSSPSPDLSFIKSSLLQDENLTVNSLTQISKEKFAEADNYKLIDSADIFFLVGFPSADSPINLIDIVFKRIAEDRIPFFITLSGSINPDKLKLFSSELPFTMPGYFSGYREVQLEVSIDQTNNPLLKHANQPQNFKWNNLPPVLQPAGIFTAKPESKVIAVVKIDNKVINSPLILSRNFSGRRSIAVLAADIWRWKLQTAVKHVNVFDNFILNSVKWLNSSEELKKVSVRTSRKNYSQGEPVEFTARVLDESLNPVSDAEVSINIKSDKISYKLIMQGAGSGLYEASIIINETGDFSYSAEAIQNGFILGSDRGNFNIGELDFEMINPVMNSNLLQLIAAETGGKYYTKDNYKNIIGELERRVNLFSNEKIITSEVTLWSDEWLLIIVIFLLSLEWFIRKNSGML